MTTETTPRDQLTSLFNDVVLKSELAKQKEVDSHMHQGFEHMSGFTLDYMKGGEASWHPLVYNVSQAISFEDYGEGTEFEDLLWYLSSTKCYTWTLRKGLNCHVLVLQLSDCDSLSINFHVEGDMDRYMQEVIAMQRVMKLSDAIGDDDCTLVQTYLDTNVMQNLTIPFKVPNAYMVNND